MGIVFRQSCRCNCLLRKKIQKFAAAFYPYQMVIDARFERMSLDVLAGGCRTAIKLLTTASNNIAKQRKEIIEDRFLLGL